MPTVRHTLLDAFHVDLRVGCDDINRSDNISFRFGVVYKIQFFAGRKVGFELADCENQT